MTSTSLELTELVSDVEELIVDRAKDSDRFDARTQK